MKDNIQLLKIPPGVKDSILPSKNLSIMEFLEFPLPPGIACESTSVGLINIPYYSYGHIFYGYFMGSFTHAL